MPRLGLQSSRSQVHGPGVIGDRRQLSGHPAATDEGIQTSIDTIKK